MRSDEKHQKIREIHHIIVDGDDIPPPIDSFEVCAPHVHQAEAHRFTRI